MAPFPSKAFLRRLQRTLGSLHRSLAEFEQRRDLGGVAIFIVTREAPLCLLRRRNGRGATINAPRALAANMLRNILISEMMKVHLCGDDSDQRPVGTGNTILPTQRSRGRKDLTFLAKLALSAPT